jgi:hypothetical protein
VGAGTSQFCGESDAGAGEGGEVWSGGCLPVSGAADGFTRPQPDSRGERERERGREGRAGGNEKKNMKRFFIVWGWSHFPERKRSVCRHGEGDLVCRWDVGCAADVHSPLSKKGALL